MSCPYVQGSNTSYKRQGGVCQNYLLGVKIKVILVPLRVLRLGKIHSRSFHSTFQVSLYKEPKKVRRFDNQLYYWSICKFFAIEKYSFKVMSVTCNNYVLLELFLLRVPRNFKPHPQDRILVPLRGEKHFKPTHKTGSWFLLGVKKN